MNPSSAFILRPVGTSLLMAAILLVGIVSYRFLPLSALPEVEYPTIQVQTFYPGASPEVMTSSVTAPLERQFGEMPSLNQMSSVSSAGASVITLQFDLSLSLDIAEQEVQAAINAAGNLLPTDLPAPPVYAKVNPADAPIMTLAITSKSLSLTDVEDLVDTRLAQKISQQPGVGLVTISGGQRPAVRVQVNMRALSAYGLNIDDLRTTIGNVNVNTPKGNFDGPAQASTINANDQLTSADQYRDVVVAYKNGAPVRLSDVATIVNGAENTKLGAWSNTTPAVILNIQRQPGANVIAVVEGIRGLLPAIEAGLPQSLTIDVLTDRTVTIRASVADVEFELLLAIALVVLVIFVFLHNVPATFIPSLSVPLSLVGTLAAMYVLGFSLDNLSLMALTISTGFVVDDAIVMIENIARYVEAGEAPLQAALKGSQQIGFTIISLTVSLLAVLIPLLFMGDVVGRLFHEFAVTLAVTIVISAIVSLTLVPMLCALLLRHRPDAQRGRFDLASERVFGWIISGYDRSLNVILDNQVLTLLVATVTVAITVMLYVYIPKGFFPLQDTGVIQGISQAAQTTSYAAMAEHQQALGAAILKDPDVVSLSSFIGVDGTNNTLNEGRFLINLKPLSDRSLNASAIIRRIQSEVADVPGVALYMQPVQDLSIDSAISRSAYRFVLEDANPTEFAAWVPRLVTRLQQDPYLANVASDLAQQGSTVFLTIDRATAGRFGITPATVDNALYDAFGQRIVSTIYTQSNQYRVILEADPALQHSIDSLNAIYLPSSLSPTGQVPLSAIVQVQQQAGPLQISHLGQFPAATISFDLAPGASLDAAVSGIRAAEKEIGLPASFITAFQGAAQALEASLSNELLLIIAAVVTMYIVLGVLYESFIHPITILSTLPAAGVGALMALMIAGDDLDIIAIIGIILLIGIVKKNAIMMIDFALVAEREEGLEPRAAIHQACLLRLRPILMTTMAALLGALPLMLGNGVGSELRRPLGVAIVGGLIVSQVLTLFTTPVIYLMFDRIAIRLSGRKPEQRLAGDGGAYLNLSAPFIARPVATTLLTLGIALAGIFAFLKLPISPLPQVDFPTISINATLPGASPDTVATSVASPLERHLGQIADVTEMTSISAVGSARITLQFSLDRNIDGAARDVEAAINAARADLPTSLRSNPTYRKVNPADSPVMILSLTSKTLTRGQLYDAASTVMQQRLSQLPGVGQVIIGGAALPAVRVELNPGPLFQYGIGLEDVRAALASANANSPKGAVEDGDQHYQIYTNDQASHAADYLPLVVAYRNGAAVRLSDVADVQDSVEDLRNQGLSNGQPAVLVILLPEPGANIINTVDGVRAALPPILAAMPHDIDITIASDRTTTIRSSLQDTERTLIIAVLLVTAVVFVFLGNLRATLIPAVAVPISILGTFGVMYLLGYSLDNLSLMALTIATGFVVDDAIVVLENIERYIELGVPRVEAALRGAREVGFTVVSISISLIAVFTPILLMGGIVGRLFREFAVTLSVAILVSMMISLTTTPMLCALFLRPHAKREGPPRKSLFERVTAGYGRSLTWSLRHGPLVILVLFLTIGLNVYLLVIIPKGFFPQEDTGRLIGGIQADQSISFQSMEKKLAQLMAIVQKDKAVQDVVGFTGGGGGGGGAQTNTGQVFVALKPLSQRSDSADQVIARLRRALAVVPGGRLYLQSIQDIRVGGRQSNAQYQFTLQADTTADLNTWGPKLTAALQRNRALADVNSDQQQSGLETELVIDRDTAAKLGVTPSQIDNTLYDAFGQRQVSTIYNPLNQYHVVMEVAPRYWQSPDSLKMIYVSTSGGTAGGTSTTNAVVGTTTSSANSSATTAANVANSSARNASSNALANTGKGGASSGAAVSTSQETMIPLSAISHYAPGSTPLAVNHQSQFVAATISFNLPPGGSLSNATNAINQTMLALHMPASIHGTFSGTAQAFQQSLSDEPLLIAAALVAIYIVLGILYESYIHPITIISTLPSAGVGAVLALMLFNTEFSIIALIGTILLIGIVKKNAILMIDFAIEAERNRGMGPLEAITQACLLRFRPIIMTTTAALLGAVPLALSFGDGGEIRRPLGISIVGGLILSQMLTLYTTPTVYLYLDRFRLWAARRAQRVFPAAPEPAE